MTSPLSRLAAFAADPSWSPVLRLEAKAADHEGVDVGDMDDQDIADWLRDRIWVRANQPSTGEDDTPELRARLEALRARVAGGPERDAAALAGDQARIGGDMRRALRKLADEAREAP